MTEQTDAAEARDPYLPDLDDETNLGLLIFEDATPGGTTKIIARILASDWLAARDAEQRRLGAEAVVAAVTSEQAIDDLTDAMTRHVRGHQSSNNPHYFYCDGPCASRAAVEAIGRAARVPGEGS